MLTSIIRLGTPHSACVPCNIASRILRASAIPSTSPFSKSWSVRIKDAHGRYIDRRKALLPPCFAQQGGWSEHGRSYRVLLIEYGGHSEAQFDRRSKIAP